MIRIRRFLKETTIGTLLAFVLSIPLATPPSHVALIAAGTLTVSTTACGADNLSKLHDILNKTAKTLNTAVKTNGNLYEQGFYGSVGSPEAVAKLHRGAQIIKDANGHLVRALTLAQNLTKETFEAGKLAVLQALSQAVGSMPASGNQTLDLILQSVATLINQAVVIVEAFQSHDLRRVLPEIQSWKLEVVSA